MSIRTVRIRDNSTGKLKDATLRSELVPLDLVRIEGEWKDTRLELVKKRIENGVRPEDIPQHWHWDWSKKALLLTEGSLFRASFCIECDGQTQGALMFTTAGHYAELEPDRGRDLVYVDFIETAPWNAKILTDEPRYGGVGTRLIKEAVLISMDREFRGRLGLRALRQSVPFYEGVC